MYQNYIFNLLINSYVALVSLVYHVKKYREKDINLNINLKRFQELTKYTFCYISAVEIFL